ncbi:MAG: radical SAM protein [Candidatus Zixiibacteriota bacterium]|nr:MAG: radical SAM protein [candidate division Zixibacteria bacterium]
MLRKSSRPPRRSKLDRLLTAPEIAARRERLAEVIPLLRERLDPCLLCPRHCAARRTRGQTGECGLDDRLRVASVARHGGEEPPLSGKQGAINVFYSGCSLHCRHCQNWPLSQRQVGTDLTPAALADRILRKWLQGAHTLGWVTPSPQIVPALEAYVACLDQGFDLPLVHNGGGYDDPEIIALLAGIVDLWLPDAKTVSPERAAAIQDAADYPQHNREALEAMVKQVRAGQARAVIVRHLVLPEATDDSRQVLEILWEAFGNRIHISLMAQYFPTYRTENHETLGRQITAEEYDGVVAFARELGFRHGWVQQHGMEHGIPLCCLP